MKATTTNFALLGIVLVTIFSPMNIDASIFVTDNKMNKMIELNNRKPHCRLHTDRGDIQSRVLNTDPLKIRQVPDETIQTLEKVCFEGNQLSGEIQGAWCLLLGLIFAMLLITKKKLLRKFDDLRSSYQCMQMLFKY